MKSDARFEQFKRARISSRATGVPVVGPILIVTPAIRFVFEPRSELESALNERRPLFHQSHPRRRNPA